MGCRAGAAREAELHSVRSLTDLGTRRVKEDDSDKTEMSVGIWDRTHSFGTEIWA